MGWANLSIDSEISKIKKISKNFIAKDNNMSEALINIAKALEKIEEAIEHVASKAYKK